MATIITNNDIFYNGLEVSGSAPFQFSDQYTIEYTSSLELISQSKYTLSGQFYGTPSNKMIQSKDARSYITSSFAEINLYMSGAAFTGSGVLGKLIGTLNNTQTKRYDQFTTDFTAEQTGFAVPIIRIFAGN